MSIEQYRLKDGSFATFDTDILQIWKNDAAVNHPVLTDEAKVYDPLYFDTLVMHVANVCNMRCEYCYERNSDSVSAPGLMSAETAVKTLDRVKYLLDTTALSQAAIGEQVGMSDSHYLGRCFKKQFGVTISAYCKNRH